MLPKECLAHPWISKHREKASCDANLEQPAGGPVMDNRQMLRYNAKRKLRRMFIYVKFLIELNRIRSMIKDRMSQNGKKYFESLLKIAEEKEKQVSEAIVSKDNTNTLKVDKIEMAANSSKLDAMLETKECAKGEYRDEQRAPFNRVRRNCASNSTDNSRNAPVQVSTLLRFADSDLNKVTSEKPPKKSKLDNTDKREEAVLKNPMPEMAVNNSRTTVRKPPLVHHLNKYENEALETKKFSIREVIFTDLSKKSASYENVSRATTNATSPAIKRVGSKDDGFKNSTISLTSEVRTKEATSAKQSIHIVENRDAGSLLGKKSSSSESTEPKASQSLIALSTKATVKNKEPSTPTLRNVLTSSVNLDEIKTETIDEKPRDSYIVKSSLKKIAPISDEKRLPSVRNSSAPEAIISVPLKTALLGAPKIGFTEVDKDNLLRVPRFGSNESGESTKENRSVEQKKPTRQGALRKKEKLTENVSAVMKPPNIFSKQTSVDVVNVPQTQPKEETATVSSAPRLQHEACSEIQLTSPKSSSATQEKMLKLSACAAPTPINEILPAKPSQKEVNLKCEKPVKCETHSKDTVLTMSDFKEAGTMESAAKSRNVKNASSYKTKVPHKLGGFIQEKVSKFNDGFRPSAMIVASAWNLQPKAIEETKDVHSHENVGEPKKSKLLPLTTESTSTTTTLTSTSTKKRKKSVEKKMQHISPGKKVEEVEKSATEEDNTEVLQVTMRKAESHERPGSATIVTKNVKEDSICSKAEKGRIVEQSKDSKKKTRTTRNTLVKSVDKVTIGKFSELDRKPTKLALTVTKNVTEKVSEKSEADYDSRGSPKTTTETASIGKVIAALDVEKNAKRCSLVSATTTTVETKLHDVPRSSNEDAKNAPNTNSRAGAAAECSKAEDQDGKFEEIAMHPQFASNELETKTTVPATVTKSTTVKLHHTDHTVIPKKKRSTITGATEKSCCRILRDDFSFNSLKEKLVFRVSTDITESATTVKSQCISIPTVNSVRDRMKRFECKN